MKDKIIEVNNVNFEKQEISNNINYYPFNYQDNNLIAGELKFKPNLNNSRHTIMMSSRFNANSREENGPFPGWFIQIVGNSLSIGIGNGKTWKSIVSTSKIISQEWNHVAFYINNNTKQASIYLNGNENTLNNITFRKPCNSVTIGALNKKGEFKFNGDIKDVRLGTLLEEKELIVENDKSDNLDSLINEADIHLETIKSNINNIKNDINSLKKIKEDILSWKYRGLQIDIELLDNQINYFINETNVFEEDTKNKAEILFILDNKINPDDNEISRDDYIEFYSTCLNNLKKDIELLNNAFDNLTNFKDLGILLGNAFETIDKQKENIKNKIIEVKEDLKQRVDRTFEIMNIVTINED
jgi:gas vesicle protein